MALGHGGKVVTNYTIPAQIKDGFSALIKHCLTPQAVLCAGLLSCSQLTMTVQINTLCRDCANTLMQTILVLTDQICFECSAISGMSNTEAGSLEHRGICLQEK